jgi:hypothetical protein
MGKATSRACAHCSAGPLRTFGGHDANFSRIALDALGERTHVVAAVAADALRMRLPDWLAKALRACGVMLGPSRSSAPSARSVADGLQLGNAVLQRRVACPPKGRGHKFEPCRAREISMT